MTNYKYYERVVARIIGMLKIQYVLSGFALHLASHFARSFSIHSYCYGFSNDQALDRSPGAEKHMDVRERPNCFASYTANSGSFMQYAS